MALEKVAATARFRTVLKKRMVCVNSGMVKLSDVSVGRKNGFKGFRFRFCVTE